MLVTVNEAVTVPVVCGLKVIVNGTLCPAGIVTGNDRPPILNTELFVVAPVTVTLAPVALRLPFADPLVPTITLPKPRVPGVMLSCPAEEVPVPDSGIVRLGFEAFEVIVTLPVAFVAEAGANVTVNVVLWFAPSVTGVESPLTLNPLPLAATCEIVTLDPPVFVSVSVRDSLLPTTTFPKLKLDGLPASAPGEIPVPFKGSVSVGFDAFEAMVTVPLALPDVAGANVIVNVVLWDAFNVSGAAIPLI